jgi:hypothetical protein
MPAVPSKVMQAIHSCEPKAIKACAMDIDNEALETGQISDSTFHWYLSLFSLPEFLRSPASSALVLTIADNWTEWSDEQKATLLESLVRAYPTFKDWMSCFAISELLGAYYGDERALLALSKLRHLTGSMPCKLLPHGFEHIAKATDTPAVSFAALAVLRGMLTDPADEVRAEAYESLARVGGRVRDTPGHPLASEVETLVRDMAKGEDSTGDTRAP